MKDLVRQKTLTSEEWSEWSEGVKECCGVKVTFFDVQIHIQIEGKKWYNNFK